MNLTITTLLYFFLVFLSGTTSFPEPQTGHDAPQQSSNIPIPRRGRRPPPTSNRPAISESAANILLETRNLLYDIGQGNRWIPELATEPLVTISQLLESGILSKTGNGYTVDLRRATSHLGAPVRNKRP
jgi:hypothetical protein